MRATADVVIIGGGIIGTAVAFYLARENMGQITLVEREMFLGACSTSKAAGGVRAQFNSKVNVEMSMLSEKLFKRFKEDTGSDALYDQVGYMFVLSDEKDIETHKQGYELHPTAYAAVNALCRGVFGDGYEIIENPNVSAHRPANKKFLEAYMETYNPLGNNYWARGHRFPIRT